MTMTRFKPSRYGIINIWDYINEVFEPVDGRLVLRGANGSGKTKALELCFPLLFDGRLDPRRLDPFSGDARTMKSNLLYRGKKTALGYAYMELSRPTPQGQEYLSIGVGLHVKAEQQSPKSWFFIAPGRVGGEIRLLDEEARPATRKELKAMLGEDAVFEKAQRYREALNKRLFGLEQDGYEAMIALALTLRRPQLAKDLDPEGLKDILNQGLRPIDQDLMLDVALAFDDLDAVQRELNQLQRAHKALTSYQTAYGTYLRSKAKQRLLHWKTQAEKQAQLAQIIQKKSGLKDKHDADARALDQAINQQRARLAILANQIRAMSESDAYKSIATLEELADEVKRAKGHCGRSTKARQELEDDLGESKAGVQILEKASHGAKAKWKRERSALLSKAEEGQIPLDETLINSHDRSALKLHIDAALSLRRQDIKAVKAALGPLEDAKVKVDEARRTQAQHEEAEAKIRGEAESAQGAAAKEASRLQVSLRAWADSQDGGILSAPLLTMLLEAIPSPDSEAPTPTPLKDILLQGFAPQEQALAARLGTLTEQVETQKKALGRLQEQRAQIEAEHDDAPPSPQTRSHQRDNTQGAPLWRLVDFKEGSSPTERGALEAALEASGILDAWVDSKGQLDPTGDTHLRALGPKPGPTLADVLKSEPEGPIPEAAIQAILCSIPLDTPDAPGTQSPVSIHGDGRFTLGPLKGQGARPAPIYIGATARARHRAHRLTELGVIIEEKEGEIFRLDAAITEVQATKEQIQKAKHTLPSDHALSMARRALIQLRAQLRQMQEVLAAHFAALARMIQTLDDQKQHLKDVARRHRTPRTREELDGLETIIRTCETAGLNLSSALEQHQGLEAQLRAAKEQIEKTSERLTARIAEEQDALRLHSALMARYETLLETQGASAEAILKDLKQAKGEQSTLQRDQNLLEKRHREAERLASELAGELKSLRERLQDAEESTRMAHEELRVFESSALRRSLTQGIQSQAVGEGPFEDWLTEVVAEVSGEASSVKASTSRATNKLQSLEQGLGTAFNLSYSFDDDLLEVKITGPEGLFPLSVFIERLAKQISEQRLLLSDSERGLFEDQLLGALCGALHVQIQSARRLVQGMDKAMATRRMSSGQTIHLKWQLRKDLQPHQKEALRHLNTEATHLGPAQLDTLRAYFSRAVKDQRRDNPETPYLDLLQRVLDYRSWHAFTLYLTSPGNQRKELTKRVYGTLSGGEKAVALHLPLFAAANAHFSGADPHCPRIIALDEAFAGIDAKGKPELINLTVAFDLDLFLTGFDLWISAEDVPGIAHYELFRDSLSGAISTERFAWYGGGQPGQSSPLEAQA